MRTRFCAMMRKPACSIMALIAPVRLRAVASGLRIEKVRSIAIGPHHRQNCAALFGSRRLIAVDRRGGKPATLQDLKAGGLPARGCVIRSPDEQDLNGLLF